MPIEDAIDLHPFAPREVVEVVRSYLEAARERGLREVRLIHGKGIGTQRERIRSLLATLPEVAAFDDAPADRGHWGATIVRLRSLSD
ncbi:MAG: Smr/MutS family protein [Candidatus Eisenbacteria bacterium]